MKRRYDVLYAIGAVVSSPVLLFGLIRSGKWRTDWKGRFGKVPPLPADPRPTLLLHGVSVGEINATRELVARMGAPGSPPLRLVISATTNTGIDRARELYGDRYPVVRFPFDFSWMVRRFLDAVRPDLVALLELEVWPNLAQECRRRGIPLVVINGRLSDSSFGNYRWAKGLVRPMFRGLAAVAAQTEEYAQRFRDLGTPPERITVADTMKWDTGKLAGEVPGARELGEALGIDPERPLVVAGSTGPGEEELLLKGRPEGVQLLLVPRKPERFEEVARMVPGIVRRSQRPDGSGTSGADSTPGPQGGGGAPSDLFLLDTMGELTRAYGLADVAVVGRSFVPLGGSDPIEAIALGRPTVMGPHFDNFRAVVGAFQEGGGIRITPRPWEVITDLLERPDEARAMGERGREVIRRRQGATQRHAALLFRCLEERRGERPLEGDLPEGGKEGGSEGRTPRRRLRRWILPALGLYMVAGYLTTAFRRVEVQDTTAPTAPLPSMDGTLLSGVFSVHTDRSHDAVGTPEQVAEAAVSSGLDFVIVGDHPPDDRKPGWEFWEPRFLQGAFIEGGQELRAPDAGKVLAIAVDTTYRQWDGNLRSFVAMLLGEDATAFVVHGRGPRESERWIHPSVAGMRGWEVLDISEAARSRLRGPWSLYHLLTLAVGLPLGLGDEALLHLMRDGFDTPAAAAYDSLRMEGPLTATAGLNVHPKVPVGPFLFPSYGLFFRTLVCHAVASGPLPADPFEARGVLTDAFTTGNLFISAGRTRAAKGFRLAAMTDAMPAARPGAHQPALGRMSLRGGFAADPGARVVYRVLRGGKEVGWFLGPDLEWEVRFPGFYRVEVYTYSARVGNTFLRLRPWIFSNTLGLLGPGDGRR